MLAVETRLTREAREGELNFCWWEVGRDCTITSE